MAGKQETRPSVLNNVSETQIMELERQFTEADHKEWDVITNSYGWSKDESQAVWDWFSQDPEKGHGENK